MQLPSTEMFVLSTLILSFGYYGTKAIPTEFSLRELDEAQAFVSCPLRRSQFNIVWGCLTTIFLSTWVAIHPNIPPPKGFDTYRRVKLMFRTLVMPEYILVWAARQWLAAWEIRDTFTAKQEYKGKRWTLHHMVWTVRQWFGERELKSEFKSKNTESSPEWTMIHAHFLIMGGFVLTDRETKARLGPLSFERFQELISNSKIDFPVIAAAEITDKSKGNVFSKIVTLLQVSWFILQSILRHAQGLEITELELVTIAITSLSAFTFCFWVYKPLGVHEPVEVYLKSEVEPGRDKEQETESQPGYAVSSNVTTSKVTELASSLYKQLILGILEIIRYPCYERPLLALYGWFILLPFFAILLLLLPVFGLFPFAVIYLLWLITPTSKLDFPLEHRGLMVAKIVSALRKVRHRLTTSINGVIGNGLKMVLETESFPHFLLGWFFFLPALFVLLVFALIFLIPFFVPFSVILIIFSTVFNIIATSVIRRGSDHVPAFYAPKTRKNQYSRIIFFAIFGALYGGIHCIGWNYAYPKTTERVIWRILSLIITTIPVLVAPLDFLVTNRTLVPRGRFESQFLAWLDLIITVFLAVYVTARLSLIVLALILLRSQPPSAYFAVEWIKFIPHVG